jgi:hypothetical protein
LQPFLAKGVLFMARVKSTDKLTKLQEQIKQLQAQEAAIVSRRKEQDRKNETRRKVIAGALALEHWEKNQQSEFGKVFSRLLGEYVTRPSDRALFPGLPPLPASIDTPSPLPVEPPDVSHDKAE